MRSAVPISLKVPLAVSTASETVTISSDAAQALENTSTTHTDVDQTLMTRLPVRSVGSGLSDVVTLAAPGVVADSNGFFHPLGDHAQTSYSIDNQPVSDQQSKAFSTQLPPNAIQSMEIITGSTPAEYGDKSSLVIHIVTPRSAETTVPVDVSGISSARLSGAPHEDSRVLLVSGRDWQAVRPVHFRPTASPPV